MLGWLLCKFGVHDTVNGSLLASSAVPDVGSSCERDSSVSSRTTAPATRCSPPASTDSNFQRAGRRSG